MKNRIAVTAALLAALRLFALEVSGRDYARMGRMLCEGTGLRRCGHRRVPSDHAQQSDQVTPVAMYDYEGPKPLATEMAWYPKGRMPDKPFPYYGENMTGFEYVVAANLAQRGHLVEAEKVVADIRFRYDGRKRNPFDEAECGHHYSRALAAWSVLMDWEAE